MQLVMQLQHIMDARCVQLVFEVRAYPYGYRPLWVSTAMGIDHYGYRLGGCDLEVSTWRLVTLVATLRAVHLSILAMHTSMLGRRHLRTEAC